MRHSDTPPTPHLAPDNSDHGRQRILITTVISIILAVAILVTLVLPAEYGWDPLGTGELLGLVGLADPDRGALHVHNAHWRNDRISIDLSPFEALEYKYRLQQDAVFIYHWRASGEVVFEMHAEPDGAAPGFAESFSSSRSNTGNGSYTAPFAGIHGWYWQNRGTTDVTIDLHTSGFYEYALEMREGRTQRHELVIEPTSESSH